MKIDLRNGDLFTDVGRFLKRLHCPKDVEWNDMRELTPSKARTCHECSRIIQDTSAMTDDQLDLLLRREPTACLKVSLSQDNCTVMPESEEILSECGIDVKIRGADEAAYD